MAVFETGGISGANARDLEYLQIGYLSLEGWGFSCEMVGHQVFASHQKMWKNKLAWD